MVALQGVPTMYVILEWIISSLHDAIRTLWLEAEDENASSASYRDSVYAERNAEKHARTIQLESPGASNLG